MKLFKNNRGEALTTIVIIVIIIVFIGWLVNIGGRECRNNRDCGSGYYCGSDFSCHEIPVIEKTRTVSGGGFVMPAFILGVCLIITAIILRWNKLGLPRYEIRRVRPEAEYQENSEEEEGNGMALKAP